MATFDAGVAWLMPVGVAVPIVVAAALLGLGRYVARIAVDVVALATSILVLVLACLVLHRTLDGRVVAWSGGWAPHGGRSVGIVLVSDPVGAGFAVLAALLVTLALLYGVRYFDSVHAQYHALILLFLAGMQGFALTGDLFDMFVFFELMGVCAYALTGFKIEDPSSLQGAVNFGVVNSIGAYGTLLGIGLLYARTGQLSLPVLGERLAGQPADALLTAAFVLVVTGFLVKAAVVPFHFWLADAHAVAPTPVCVLFSGVMVPLGLYAAFRVYWTVFSGVRFPAGDIRHAFVALGLVTALVGAVMCVSQRHTKRLLAFSTMAHVGLFLVALGCLTAAGTAAGLVYIAGDAGVKGALFLLAGIMLNRYGSVDELDLFGRGARERFVPWLFLLAGFVLAGLPPFGSGLGKALGEDAATATGYGWAPWLFVIVSAITGAAVLRVTARVYFGMGWRPAPEQTDDRLSGSTEEREATLGSVPITMGAAIVLLLLGSLAVGVVPEMRELAGKGAAYFVDRVAYTQQALGTAHGATPAPAPASWTTQGVVLDLVSVGLAAVIAGLALFGHGALERRPGIVRAPGSAMRALHRLHSGHVGDYVAWFVLGTAVIAGLVGLPTL